jgi:TPR repeat protein
MLSARLFRLMLVALAAPLAAPVHAADRKVKKKAEPDARDSVPILMSKTDGAGGDMWANVKELTAAAEKGNPKAKAQLGEMLLRGDAEHKVTQDRPRAIAMLEEAARAEVPSAAFRIGMLLDDGEFVLQDNPRALFYFRSAAAGGASEAYFNIGAAYAGGKGVKPDLAEGLGWLILAGNKGATREAEEALRTQLEANGGSHLIAQGEKRAEEIERELAARKPVEWLPPVLPIVPLNAAGTAKSEAAAADKKPGARTGSR